jgi:hypothetical protein
MKHVTRYRRRMKPGGELLIAPTFRLVFGLRTQPGTAVL